MEHVNNLVPYVLKLFPSSKKHKMRYGRNGYIDISPRVERLISQNILFCNHPFAMIVTYDKISFHFMLCNQADIGFTIVSHCDWLSKLPIHILYRFKLANDCTAREIDNYCMYTATDI